ncbi:2-hydroxy-3-keto-5-methylthiopentenyl-1-phosphate phosphatase [Paraburkholderia atlantica]
MARSGRIARIGTYDTHDGKDEDDAQGVPGGLGKVLKRLHHPLDVILLCVRWHVAYSLSLRNVEEMMAEHGLEVPHLSAHLDYQVRVSAKCRPPREWIPPSWTVSF